MNLTEQIKTQAQKLGFDLVGIVPAEPSRTIDLYEQWLKKRYAGEMSYLERHLPLKRDPHSLLPEAKSIIALAMNYYTLDPPSELTDDPSRGQISRYAWGTDYHETIRTRLKQLAQFIEDAARERMGRHGDTETRGQGDEGERCLASSLRVSGASRAHLEDKGAKSKGAGARGRDRARENENDDNRQSSIVNLQSDGEVKTRIYVDTAPILEREYAQNAGIGWIAKNTNVINWQSGSWFFLAGIVLSIELDYNVLPPRGSCGTCTRCIDACPTDAIVAPNVLDSRLCISYLTIELKGSIPRELRPQMGNLIFGCDICQEVCPWNSKAMPTKERAFYPRKGNLAPELLSLINMTQEEFSRRFKRSPIKRAKRRGLLRNVAIALGNWKDRSATSALKEALNDDDSLVRGHAAWALGQIGGQAAIQALQACLQTETHAEVIEEIEAAIASTKMEMNK